MYFSKHTIITVLKISLGKDISRGIFRKHKLAKNFCPVRSNILNDRRRKF